MQIGFEHFLLVFVTMVAGAVFYFSLTYNTPACRPGEFAARTWDNGVVCVVGRRPQ